MASISLSDTLPADGMLQTLALLQVHDGSFLCLFRVPSRWVDLPTLSLASPLVVWTPALGKRFRFMGLSLSLSAKGSILFKESQTGIVLWRTPILDADQYYSFDLGPKGKLATSINNTVVASTTVAASITGQIYGTEE